MHPLKRLKPETLLEFEEAKAGDSIGVKVPERVRKGDTVYKVVE
jgi:hypothetical protein